MKLWKNKWVGSLCLFGKDIPKLSSFDMEGIIVTYLCFCRRGFVESWITDNILLNINIFTLNQRYLFQVPLNYMFFAIYRPTSAKMLNFVQKFWNGQNRPIYSNRYYSSWAFQYFYMLNRDMLGSGILILV